MKAKICYIELSSKIVKITKLEGFECARALPVMYLARGRFPQMAQITMNRVPTGNVKIVYDNMRVITLHVGDTCTKEVILEAIEVARKCGKRLSEIRKEQRSKVQEDYIKISETCETI
jgi:hypothetical protein